jgi:predicted RNase H-like nuclease
MSALPVADKHREACRRSRASAPHGKGISRQTFNILPKIREVNDLLRERPELRDLIREIHPELFDAAAACWSARRLATGQGRSLPEVIPFDSTGLPMAIWW